MGELLRILEQIEAAFGVRICVHDVSGITLASSALTLPIEWKTHGCQYCSVAKDYGTVQRCMRQKEVALYLLKRRQHKPYCGICHMGVCDYLEPVELDGKLLAVVFAGGITKEQKEKARMKLAATADKLPFECPELMMAYDEYVASALTTEAQLKLFAEFVASYIRQTAKLSAFGTDLPDDPIGQYPVEPIKAKVNGTASVIVSYLEENYMHQLSLKALSMRFFMSEGHLNRLVRQEVGMGAIAYVKHVRVNAAARLLENTDKSVHDIAENCGFRDVNYFCRAFKDKKGLSPTEYRRRYAIFNVKAQMTP